MPSDRTNQMYGWWKDAAEKYDYFMAGVCLAITSYLGQNLAPAALGFNGSTLEVVAVLVFAAASFCALKRIQTTAHLLRLQLSGAEEAEKHGRALEAIQHEGPVLGDRTGKLIPRTDLEQRSTAHAQRREIVDTQSKKSLGLASRYFAARDNLLIIGIVLVVIARVWAAQSPPAPPNGTLTTTPAVTAPGASHHRAAPPNPSYQQTPPR